VKRIETDARAAKVVNVFDVHAHTDDRESVYMARNGEGRGATLYLAAMK
jgi:hypothetical protein